MNTIDCVICDSTRKFNKYVRIEKDDVTSSVDYVSITSKLIKSDFHDVNPHPFIVGMAIRNAFNNIRKKQVSERVIYLLKNLDEETIENFKELVYGMFCGLEEINLITINVDDVPEDIIDMFDNHEKLQF